MSLFRLWQASLLDMVLLLSWLFVEWEVHYSRWTFVLFFLISVGALSGKRIVLRKLLRYFRQKGYNQKHVLIVGGGGDRAAVPEGNPAGPGAGLPLLSGT